MSSGGIHNHGLAATDRPAASESTVPGGAPRLQQDSAASPEAPCIACLWQLQSAAASSISPDVPAERVAPFRVPTYKGQSGVEEAFGFDPRAPPLS